MSSMPKSSRRTMIPDQWRPSADDVAFAESKGVVDVEDLVGEFQDYHAAHGTLMLSWSAAWKTWVRGQVRFGRATGQRTMPLFSVVASGNDDEYGAKAWATTLRDAVQDKMPDGTTALCVGGYDAAATAIDVCRAIGLPPTWRGNLECIGDWLRDGIDPERMLATLKGSLRGKSPSYYDARVRERAGKLSA